MTRSRAAGVFRPVGACLMLGMLAACGGTAPQRVVTQAPASVNSEWQRPNSYDPPGSSRDPWGPYITQASRRFDVPERWIREVMRQESGGRQSATSPVGAMGLMQVMPGTYAELTRRYGLGGDPYHPWDNIMAGTAYLREMYELYGSPAFLAAYNAGPRRLEDYLWGGRGLPTETRNYVARIGPRIAGASPNRRAAPEVYAAAEIPLNIPRGPRRGDTATMLALREQRQAVDPAIRVAQLPPGPVVRMDPIPDGSTYGDSFAQAGLAPAPAPAPTRLAAAGSVVSMSPIVSPGDFQNNAGAVTQVAASGAVTRMEPVVSAGDPGVPLAPATTRMEPVVSPGNPGTIGGESLAPAPRPTALAAVPVQARRGFSLIPQAQASTLPRAPAPAPTRAAPGSGWGIQVGAFASQNLARAAAGQAHDAVAMMGTRVVVEPVGEGRSRLYRARVVGLSSRNAAEQACDRQRRGACMIVSPGA